MNSTGSEAAVLYIETKTAGSTKTVRIVRKVQNVTRGKKENKSTLSREKANAAITCEKIVIFGESNYSEDDWILVLALSEDIKSYAEALKVKNALSNLLDKNGGHNKLIGIDPITISKDGTVPAASSFEIWAMVPENTDISILEKCDLGTVTVNLSRIKDAASDIELFPDEENAVRKVILFHTRTILKIPEARRIEEFAGLFNGYTTRSLFHPRDMVYPVHEREYLEGVSGSEAEEFILNAYNNAESFIAARYPKSELSKDPKLRRSSKYGVLSVTMVLKQSE